MSGKLITRNAEGKMMLNVPNWGICALVVVGLLIGCFISYTCGYNKSQSEMVPVITKVTAQMESASETIDLAVKNSEALQRVYEEYIKTICKKPEFDYKDLENLGETWENFQRDRIKRARNLKNITGNERKDKDAISK